MGNRHGHACEVAHDEGHQIGGHGRGSGKAGGGQACWQFLRGNHGHVGQSSEAGCGGEADVKGGLQTTEQPHIRCQWELGGGGGGGGGGCECTCSWGSWIDITKNSLLYRLVSVFNQGCKARRASVIRADQTTEASRCVLCMH